MKSIVDLDTGEITELTEEEWFKKVNQHLSEWYKVKQDKELADEKEKDLRQSFVRTFSDPARVKGSEVLKLDGGWSCKITKQLNFSFRKSEEGKPLIGEINKALAEIATTMPNGADIVSRLVSWEPKLSVAEYNVLPMEVRNIIDRVLITKPGSVSIELVQPRTAQ